MTFHDMAAVVVTHPGHEVRIHGWLERERSLVFVLTDGAGRASGRPLADALAENAARGV
jgi:hypothetical protein